MLCFIFHVYLITIIISLFVSFHIFFSFFRFLFRLFFDRSQFSFTVFISIFNRNAKFCLFYFLVFYLGSPFLLTQNRIKYLFFMVMCAVFLAHTLLFRFRYFVVFIYLQTYIYFFGCCLRLASHAKIRKIIWKKYKTDTYERKRRTKEKV